MKDRYAIWADKPSCPYSERVAAFNHHSQDHHNDLLGLWSYMREKTGLSRSNSYDGFYIATRYDDVMAIANNHKVFISGDGINIPELPQHAPHIPIEMDPPEHTQFRQLIASFFSRSKVDALSEDIDKIAKGILADFANRSTVDVVENYAKPLAIGVTLSLLELPLKDAKYLDDLLTTQRLKRSSPEGKAAAVALVDYLKAAISDYQNHHTPSRTHLFSAIVFAEIDGRKLSIDEQVSIIRLLLFGGFDTTAMTIAASVLWLAQNPNEANRIRQDFSILDRAVDEFIRYASPAGYLRRTAAEQATVGGCVIAKGEKILISYAAANHDPEKFADGHFLNLSRKSNPHIAFGSGVHRCIGSWLAKLEIRIAIEQILRTFKNIELNADKEIIWECGENLGLSYLPIMLER